MDATFYQRYRNTTAATAAWVRKHPGSAAMSVALWFATPGPLLMSGYYSACTMVEPCRAMVAAWEKPLLPQRPVIWERYRPRVPQMPVPEHLKPSPLVVSERRSGTFGLDFGKSLG